MMPFSRGQDTWEGGVSTTRMTRDSHIRQSFCIRSHFRLQPARKQNDVATVQVSEVAAREICGLHAQFTMGKASDPLGKSLQSHPGDSIDHRYSHD
jgi:hypothetical protein